MTVGEFQTFLFEVSRFLRSSKSPAVAKELEEVSAKLASFKDYKLKPFADLLVKAEEYARLDPQVKAARTPRATAKAKVDPAAVDQACLAVLQLYNRAIDPSVTLDQVETTVKGLQTLDPPMAKLNELAQKMGFVQKFKKKDDVLKAVRQKILSVKGTWDRKDA
jgi:hypothetical protein